MVQLGKVVAAGTLLAMAQVASAQSPFSFNVGAINVNPTSDRSSISEAPTLGVGVEDDTTLGFTVDYFVTPNFAVEVIAALPFEHEIDVDTGSGVSAVGTTKHLPPTVVAQYHFGADTTAFRPFVGVGANYTEFFSEEAQLAGATDLELDSSFGLAGQVGFNFRVDQTWGVHFMATYIDINTDATVVMPATGNLTSDVSIDPLVIMLGAKFNL